MSNHAEIRVGSIVAALAGLAAALCLLAAPAPAAAGTIVAESDFRPDPDGFSFANYGDGYADLNATEVERIFGRKVCLTYRKGKCVLTPTARIWMESQNKGMAGGHCFGFAALTGFIERKLLRRFGYQSLSAFGPADNAFGLDIDGSVVLQRSIARAHTFQSLASVIKREVTKTPSKMVGVIRDALESGGKDPWIISIYNRDRTAGHGITPYALEDMGDGTYDVHVYDNNWPGDSDRRLTIDTDKDTWEYTLGDPGDPDAWVFEGDAKTKSLGLITPRPGLGVQPCPFCIGRKGGKSKYNEITLDGAGDQHSHLLITDNRGRRTGFVRGRLVNQIPGVQVIARSSGVTRRADGTIDPTKDSMEPLYRVPKRVAFKVKIDGRELTRTVRERLTLVGPTYDSTVENLRMRPGQVAKLRLSPRGNELRYRSSATSRRPTVSFGAETKEIGYRIAVTARKTRGSAKLRFVKHAKEQLLRIGDRTKRLQRFRVEIERVSAQGRETMARRFKIRGAQQAYLYYGPLARPKGVGKLVIYAPGKKGKRQIRVLPIRARG